MWWFKLFIPAEIGGSLRVLGHPDSKKKKKTEGKGKDEECIWEELGVNMIKIHNMHIQNHQKIKTLY